MRATARQLRRALVRLFRAAQAADGSLSVASRRVWRTGDWQTFAGPINTRFRPAIAHAGKVLERGRP